MMCVDAAFGQSISIFFPPMAFSGLRCLFGFFEPHVCLASLRAGVSGSLVEIFVRQVGATLGRKPLENMVPAAFPISGSRPRPAREHAA